MDIDSSALLTLLPDDETHGNHLRAPSIGILDLRMTASGKSSKFHVPRQTPLTPKTDGRDDFNFLPEHDTGELVFEIDNPFDIIDKAKLEVFKRDNDQPLATIDLIKLDRNWVRHGVHKVTWDGRIVSDAAPAPGTIAAEETTHDLTTVAPKTDAAATAPFPDGYLTLEHGPYKLRLELESDLLPGKPAVAWTYVHVLLDRIELSIGPEEAIPNDGTPPKLAMDKVVRQQIEHDGFPAEGSTLKVYLLHNNFKNEDNEFDDTANFDYTSSAIIWGDGPRIPILAKIWLTAANGSGIDLETSAKGALALGRARFMWDVEDPDEVPQPEPAGRAANDKARKFVKKSIKYYNKSKDSTRSADNETYYQGDNCHVDRGGRRGPGATIHFPDQAGYAAQATLNAAQFPFQVGSTLVAPTKRLWAAFSIGWTSGKLKGYTGVLFRPSRIAGDNYIVTVRLPWDWNDKGVWITDVKKKDIPAPEKLVKKSGIFEIWRRTQVVRYIRKTGGVTDFLPNFDQMADYYKPAYIDMKQEIGGGDNYLMAAHCSPAGGAAFDYNALCQGLLAGAGLDIYTDGSLKRTPENHAGVAATFEVPAYADFVQALHIKHFAGPANDFALAAAAAGVSVSDFATGLARSAELDVTAGTPADQARATRINATRNYLRTEGLHSLVAYSYTLEGKMKPAAKDVAIRSACISGGGPSGAVAPPGITVMHYQYLTSAAQEWVDAGNADHDGLRGSALDVNGRARDKVVFALWRPLIPTFAHEIGHHLFLPHTNPPSDTASALQVHDAADKGRDPAVKAVRPMCLMSYHSERHGFCGFCQLRLRGWNWNAAGGPLQPKAGDNTKT
jgi:hypothetical protein